jgi:hypothetical protein
MHIYTCIRNLFNSAVTLPVCKQQIKIFIYNIKLHLCTKTYTNTYVYVYIDTYLSVIEAHVLLDAISLFHFLDLYKWKQNVHK